MRTLNRARIAPVVWSLCAIAISTLLPSTGFTQTADAPATVPWQRAPGAANDIAVGANGTVWAIGRATQPGGYDIYRRDGANWTRIPGGAERIAVDPQGNAWVVNNAQNILRFDGAAWAPVPGQQARDIGVGANGTVWVIGSDAEAGGYGIYRSSDRGASWTKVPGSALRISVDPQGNAWVVNSAQNIFRFDGAKWVTMPGSAKDIGVGADGSVWAIGSGGGIHRWEGSAWAKKTGGGTQIAAGPSGAVWVVQGGGEIYQAQVPVVLGSTTIAIPAAPTAGSITINQSPTVVPVIPVQNVPPPPGTAVPAPASTVSWVGIAGAANDVGVGANGRVWVIGRAAVPGGYDIYRRDGSNWTRIPGGAVRVAVDPQGNAWVVNSGQAIFRYDGTNWIQVSGAAFDVGIGANGTVWAIGNVPEAGGYAIYRTSDKGASWTKVPGSALRISVDPQGNAWVVNKNNAIFRFDGSQWVTVAGSAKDIGIGADGAVWTIGTDGGIYRYEGATWAKKPGGAAQIAAGPNGNVWVVNDGGGIYQAQAAPVASLAAGQTIATQGSQSIPITPSGTSTSAAQPGLTVGGGANFIVGAVGTSRATCGLDVSTGMCPTLSAELVRNASIQCPSGSFPDLGLSSCWSCPSGYTRSIHAVDNYKACQKPDATVPGGYSYATYAGALCDTDSFYDPIRGGECYSCEVGYGRTAAHVNAGDACRAAGENLSAATRIKNTALAWECPAGSFWDPVGACFSCPSGYARTAYAVSDSRACSQPKVKAATLVRKAQCGPGEIQDARIQGEQNVARGGGCWTCAQGTDRTIHPVDSAQACERAPGIVWAAATRAAPMTCEQDEIFDPINSNNANVATALQTHNSTPGAKPITAASSGGTCWTCAPGSKRTQAPVYRNDACKTDLIWKPAPYNQPGLFGLRSAEAVALKLVNERTLIDSTIQGFVQNAQPGTLPANYARSVWEEIGRAPQDSMVLKLAVFSRVVAAANQPANATTDEIALRDSAREEIRRFRLFMADNALAAWQAWDDGESYRSTKYATSQLQTITDVGPVPPDFEDITAGSILGNLTAVGASNVAIGLTVPAVFDKLFPFVDRTAFDTARAAKEAIAYGAKIEKAAKAARIAGQFAKEGARATATTTRIAGEAAKAGVQAGSSVTATIASIGPQIIVTIAIEVLWVAIEQQIEIANAEPKLKASKASAQNDPIDFVRLMATAEGTEVAKGYWSLLMAGPAAPNADSAEPAEMPPFNVPAFAQAAAARVASLP